MAIEIVDFPIKNGGSFHSYVSLPEGIHILVGGLEHVCPYIGNNHPKWLSYFSEGLKCQQTANLTENANHLAVYHIIQGASLYNSTCWFINSSNYFDILMSYDIYYMSLSWYIISIEPKIIICSIWMSLMLIYFEPNANLLRSRKIIIPDRKWFW